MHAAAAAAFIAVATVPGILVRFLLAALVLLAGVTLFWRSPRARCGLRLFPMTAPSGGSTMIVGWLLCRRPACWEVFAQRG